MSQTDKTELQSTLRTLSSKVEDLSTCNDLIAKHGTALQRSLSELESLRLPADSTEKIKQVNERATLFRITSNAMINVSDTGGQPRSAPCHRGAHPVSPSLRLAGISCCWPRPTARSGRSRCSTSGISASAWRRRWSSWPSSTTTWRGRSVVPPFCPPALLAVVALPKVSEHSLGLAGGWQAAVGQEERGSQECCWASRYRCPLSSVPRRAQTLPVHRPAGGQRAHSPLCLCRPPDPCCSAKGDLSDEDDDNEFFDAPEIITVPESMGHK